MVAACAESGMAGAPSGTSVSSLVVSGFVLSGGGWLAAVSVVDDECNLSC